MNVVKCSDELSKYANRIENMAALVEAEGLEANAAMFRRLSAAVKWRGEAVAHRIDGRIEEATQCELHSDRLLFGVSCSLDSKPLRRAEAELAMKCEQLQRRLDEANAKVRALELELLRTPR